MKVINGFCGVNVIAALLSLLLGSLSISCGGGSSNNGSEGGTGGAGNASWVPIATQPPGAGSFLLIDNNGNFYVSLENAGGMVVSRDHGSTWQPLNTGFVNRCHNTMVLNGLGEPIASDASNISLPGCTSVPNHLYRLQGGNTWLQASPGFFGSGQSPYFTLGTTSGSRIFAGGRAGGSVFISVDDGNSYTECAGCPGLFSPTTTAETFDLKPGPGGFLYVGTAGMGTFFSSDNGDHWTQMPCRGGLSCGGGTGRVADNQALGQSPDGSLLVQRDLDTGSVACYGPQPPPNGSWRQCDRGLSPGAGGHPNAITSGPSGFWLNPSKSRVFLAANNKSGHVGDVYSSSDGAIWNRDDKGLPQNPNAIDFAVDPGTGLLYVLINPQGIYHTTARQ
jgi:hypothetical protein